jgi:hypothetical protein
MQVMVIVDSYLATAAVASGLLRDPSLARRWDEPSALDGFAVSGLAGHLAGNVSNVESEEAADLVVVALARIAVGRRGLPPVLRALSRRERATDLATAL